MTVQHQLEVYIELHFCPSSAKKVVHVIVSNLLWRVCVYRLLYSCSRINELQVRVSTGFYSNIFFDLMWICKIMLRSLLLTCHIAAFSEECMRIAKLVHGVLLL